MVPGTGRTTLPDRHDRGGFGQPVALQQQDPRGGEEIIHVGRQGPGAGHAELELPAQTVLDLLEHQQLSKGVERCKQQEGQEADQGIQEAAGPLETRPADPGSRTFSLECAVPTPRKK